MSVELRVWNKINKPRYEPLSTNLHQSSRIKPYKSAQPEAALTADSKSKMIVFVVLLLAREEGSHPACDQQVGFLFFIRDDSCDSWTKLF
jgi:hypothetical protein